MITENLITRLNAQAAQHVVANVRKGRHRALASISKYCIVTTKDGIEMSEVLFDEPPTIGQLEARVGTDAWVVSVTMQRMPSQKARQRYAVAAE